MNELESYIRSYFGVSPENIGVIKSLFVLEEVPSGTYYTKAGSPCEKLSFIKSGVFRVYKSVDTKEVTQWIGTPGYFVTDLQSLVFDLPSRWSIQCTQNSELYTISKKDYNTLNTVMPEWPQLEKKFLAKCFLALEDRVFSLISKSARERYAELMSANPSIFNEVPLHNIASMLGMSPETLSRIRSERIS